MSKITELASGQLNGTAVIVIELVEAPRVSRRTAAKHRDTGTAKLVAHRGRRYAQLRTDLAQSEPETWGRRSSERCETATRRFAEFDPLLSGLGI